MWVLIQPGRVGTYFRAHQIKWWAWVHAHPTWLPSYLALERSIYVLIPYLYSTFKRPIVVTASDECQF
jgi:hypothetical protein